MGISVEKGGGFGIKNRIHLSAFICNLSFGEVLLVRCRMETPDMQEVCISPVWHEHARRPGRLKWSWGGV